MMGCNAHGATPAVDVLKFGDAASEQAHRLTAERSEIIRGGLGEPARRLLAPMANDWRGGSVAFELGVAPETQNYVTVTLWGGEENHDYLALSCDGKQIGSRHLGDPDVLDIGSEAPLYEGRFFHNTSPLPVMLTKGKKTLSCRIDSSGPVWAYGRSFEQFQKAMTEPSRGIYVLTVHTDPFLPAGAMELKGTAPLPRIRSTPGPEVLDALKSRVGSAIDKLLAARRPLNQPELQFVARAYDVDWTSAYHNAAVGPILVRGLDAYFQAFRAHPEIVGFEPSTFNPEWFGLGPAGQAIMLRHQLLEPFLEEAIADPRGGKITRRAAYVEMLAASREWHRAHRRFYTNQSMINDTYGIYLANRGIEALDPSKASPETEMLRYLYESVGLQPWRGDDLPGGGHRWKAGGPDGTDKGAYGVGQDYHEITDKGLTRELGYVGNYGEVLDWVGAMYEATRPSPSEPGDAAIRAQLLKITKARASFRYPLPDADGYRAMRLETVVGWRDIKYPGDVTYCQRNAWDASSLQVAVITQDPTLIAYAQQMFADNQFFHSVQERMKVDNLRVNMGLLNTPGEYAALTRMPRQQQRLPMSDGEPDFVFSDEEDGVLAVKVGEEILYASLYWRARSAVNGLAKIHYLTPQLDRMAVVYEDTMFAASGEFWTRPEMATWGFANAPPFQYPGLVAAHTGEKLPIAKAPAGIQPLTGDESPYAGKADFYTLRYGPFTVGMNTTKTQTFELVAPDQTELRELVSNRAVPAGARLSVGPRATVILYRKPTDNTEQPPKAFHPGAIWPDSAGVPINAHGGGILLYGKTYYWFGEHKVPGAAGNRAEVGVHVYSSRNLYDWKDEGIALSVSDDPGSEIVRGSIIERPKVLYNRRTGKFVMWFHLELTGQGYRAARSGVAIADRATGPYRYLGSFRPNAGLWPLNATGVDREPDERNFLARDFEGGQMARDMTLFADDDGKAYQIYASEENHTLHVSLLSDDYLRPAGRYARILPWGDNEAPAIFKRRGRYYLLTSGLSGWKPNAARSAVADSIWGPWRALGNPVRGTPEECAVTFEAQSTFVLPVPEKKDAFIFMADRWRPENAIDGRYVWLPIQFEQDKPVLRWVAQWNLSFFDGQ